MEEAPPPMLSPLCGPEQTQAGTGYPSHLCCCSWYTLTASGAVGSGRHPRTGPGWKGPSLISESWPALLSFPEELGLLPRPPSGRCDVEV